MLEALTSLALVCGEAEEAVELLTYVSACQLRHIAIEFSGELGTPELWNHLCRALAAHVSHSSLRRLQLANDFPVDEDGLEEVGAVKFDAIRPLLAFHGITSLNLNIPLGLDLDDPCLGELARAFPAVENLDLYKASVQHSPQATLAGIAACAEHYLRISEISLQVDAMKIKTTPSESPRVRPSDRRVRLDFYNSPINGPRAVASKLYKMFPKAVSASGCDKSEERSEMGLWDEVYDFVLRLGSGKLSADEESRGPNYF
ncbi:hypothetical protein LshimejAT787_0901290 [Lyophyllum shimeji]|uniref:Uncharacterized protein n=1 Tax=Lyophyllum shimeji TaxID=47721 RepID=A0A9P3UMW0_LYOSH|nr:hypothetical protein LshimejAT787_0901290 [Lyophyllum shimeji]